MPTRSKLTRREGERDRDHPHHWRYSTILEGLEPRKGRRKGRCSEHEVVVVQAPRTLPWRQPTSTRRKGEAVRPIHWCARISRC